MSVKQNSKLCLDSELSAAMAQIDLNDKMLKTYPKLIELAMCLQQNPTWSSNQVCIAVLITCQQIIAEFMPEDKMDVGRELLAEWDKL